MRGYTEIATRALGLDLMSAEMVWACPGATRGVNSIMRVGNRAWRLVSIGGENWLSRTVGS